VGIQAYLFNKIWKKCKGKKSLLEPLIKVYADGGDLETINQVTYFPEYHNIFQTLQWVGLSFGEKESYMLTNSLRNLAFPKNLPNGVTLWENLRYRKRLLYCIGLWFRASRIYII
jgi:hypothetical protein